MNYRTTLLLPFLCLSSIFFLHAMEKQSPKPIIEGFIIPIDLTYHWQEYHDDLHTISNMYSNISIPVVQVAVFYQNSGFINSYIADWTQKTPNIIYNYEKCSKEFPQYVPLTLFYNKQEGDVLSLKIHGYEARLTCIGRTVFPPNCPENYDTYNKNEVITENKFEVRLNELIANFQAKIFNTKKSSYNPCIAQFCIDHKILEPKDGSDVAYVHGKNGFKDMQTSMVSLIQGKANLSTILLLLYIKNNAAGA